MKGEFKRTGHPKVDFNDMILDKINNWPEAYSSTIHTVISVDGDVFEVTVRIEKNESITPEFEYMEGE